MTVRDMKIAIIDALKTLDVCLPYKQDTQYMIRCMSCGDSTDPTHGHLSVNVDIEDRSPMRFRCFKCSYSGLVTSSWLLNDVGVALDQDVIDTLDKFNHQLVRKNNHSDKHLRNLVVPQMSEKELLITGNMKVEYVADRLGVNPDVIRSNQETFKLILDLFHFVEVNGLKTVPNVSYKQMNFINRNYVGFLSSNSNSITCRRFVDNDKLDRYHNLIINPKIDNANTFYKLPISLDLMYTHDINIHIAEGIFDILSVYINLMNMNNENNFYFGCNGFRFNSVIKYLVTNGLNTGLIVHIYSDKDKSDDNHMFYIKKHIDLFQWVDRIFIHRNMMEGQKDFGVPLSQIKDEYTELRFK